MSEQRLDEATEGAVYMVGGEKRDAQGDLLTPPKPAPQAKAGSKPDIKPNTTEAETNPETKPE